MTKELERIYGSPVQLHMFSMTPDEQELIRATETLIHELRNLPENFELISIIPSDFYDKSAKVYLKIEQSDLEHHTITLLVGGWVLHVREYVEN